MNLDEAIAHAEESYNKALDDLMQKIACDRTLLDGWQLRAIQRKADQLKEVHHG